ncbi:MAG: extracellular solute-binding protein [Anaerolineae bacterium]|nr:extracellular solute-binding protein [Anaerolineae bacterium]
MKNPRLLLIALLALTMIFVACSSQAEPEIVEVTRVVAEEVEVTRVVEGETVVEEVEVTRIVEVPAEEAASGEPVTITYLASQDWIKDAEMDLAAQFEAETGIHVDYQIIPSDQYFNVLLTKLDAGEGVDIFGGQSGKSDIKLQLNVEENALPLTDEEWVQRMNPLSTEQLSLDGVTYGLTIWDTIGGSWVIVYNKDIFAEHGLAIPTTYEEFAAASQTLLDAGITPIYEPVADGWHHVLWFPELGPVYESANPGLAEILNSNETTFTEDPTMLLALTQLQEMYDNGFFGEDALANEFANTEAAMASGDYAMTLNRFGLPDQIETAYPEVSADSFGFFVMPLADNQMWNVNPAGPSKFIYSGTTHPDAAKAYFEFLTRPENLQYMLDNEPQFALLNFEGVNAELSAEQQAFVDTYTEQGTVYQTAVTYVNPQWMDIGQDLTAMFTGAASPEDVLSFIDQRRADMATAAGDPAWQK